MKKYIYKFTALIFAAFQCYSASAQPAGFSFVITGFSHIIYIPAGSVTINGMPLSSGSYIGVFFSNAGVPTCGGNVAWNGNARVMSAWQDDSQTTVKEGFASNELIQWKIWDSVTDSVYDAIPEYFPAGTGTFANAGNFIANGMSGLSSLHVGSLSFNVTSVVTPASCYTSTDGAVQLSATGGQSPYAYLWSNSGTSSNNQNLQAGIYIVTITDFSGTAQVQAAYVNALNSTMNISISDTTTGNTHHLWAMGGNTSSTYAWSNGAVTDSITVTDPGTYSLTVTNSNGCAASASFTVSAPPIQVSHTVVNTCSGSATGQIQLTVTGGITPYTYLWSNNATTSTITGLTAGTYHVTVTSTDGQTISDVATVTSLTVSVTSSYAAGTYTLNATITGGTTPYSFIWSNGATTEDITTTVPGTYSLTVTDSNSCTNTLSAYAYLSLQVSHIISYDCPGTGTGIIQLNVTGGLTPYIYHWSNNATTSTITGLTAGTYHVTVTSADNQTITDYATATTLSVSVTSSYTSGTYTFNSTITGGTSPYSYNWSNGATTVGITTTVPGTYYLTVTDINSCMVTASKTVYATLQVSHTIISISCNGSNDGQVQLTVSGGLTPYTYHWSNNATTSAITGLAAGTYNVTVHSADNQTITDQASITSPSALQLSITNTAVSNSYFLNSTATGGTSPYFYLWSNGATAEDITVSSPGTYKLTVTDSHSCFKKDTIFATQPSPWTCNIYTGAHEIFIPANTVYVNGNPLSIGSYIGVFYSLPAGGIACGGYIVWTGNANALAAWGDDPMTPAKDGFSTNEAFQWKIWDISTSTEYDAYPSYMTNQPNQGFFAINGLSGLTSLSNQNPLFTVNYYISDVTCYNGNDGSVSLTVSGGQTPYSYLWSNGQTTAVATGLASGNYLVTVSDISGIPYFEGFLIHQPGSLNSGISVTGSYNLNSTTTGGTQPYTYLWSNGATTGNITVTNLDIYYLTVTDAHTCTIIDTVTTIQPLQVNQTVTNTSCSGSGDGQIQLTVTGGITPYTYLWSNNATISVITGLSAGTYQFTVTSADNQTITNQATVISMSVTITSSYAAGIYTLTTTINGGISPYSFNWSNGATTESITTTVSGTYSLTVTDNNSCTAITSKVVYSLLQVSHTITNASCNGSSDGQIHLTVSGGLAPYVYHWSNSATTSAITGIPSGTYHVTVTSADGQVIIDQPHVTCPAYLMVNITYTTNSGSYLINSTPIGGTSPYDYLWSTGATTDNITVANTGVYSLTVTDSHSCIITASELVTGTISWTYVNTGVNHSIIIPSNTVYINGIPLANGSYIGVFYSLPAGGIACGGYVTWSGITCALTAWGDDPMTPAKDGFASNEAFQWKIWDITTNSEYNANPMYIITMPNQGFYVTNGMSGLTSLSNLIPPLTVNYISTNVSCHNGNDGSVSLTVTGGQTPYSYLWSSGATTAVVTGLAAGAYHVTVTDISGTPAIEGYVITQPSALNSVNIITSSYNLNPNTSGGTPPYTYLWSTGATTSNITVTNPDTYYLTVTDAHLCSIIVTAIVFGPLQITGTVTNATCNGSGNGQIQLTVTGDQTPYSYFWSTGATTESVTGLAAGTYDVTVSGFIGAAVIEGFVISQPPAMNSGITVTGYYDLNSTTTGGTPPYTYLWSNGATDGNITVTNDGIYYLTVTDSQSCTIIDSASVVSVLQISYTSVNVTCYGLSDGQIQLTVNGGMSPYTYLWSTGATTDHIAGLAAGMYHVTVSDAAGAENVQIIHVTQPAQLQAGINVNGSDTLVASYTGGIPPVTFNWSTGETTQHIIVSAFGTYSVTITDSNGCSSVADTLFSNGCNINVTSVISGVTVIGADDGFIDLTVTGGNPPFYFSWSNGSTTEDIYGLSSGLYTVTIGQTDSLCQPVNYTFHILEPYQNIPLDTLFTNPIDTCLNFPVDSFYVEGLSVQGNLVTVTWVLTGNSMTATFPVTYVFGDWGTYLVVLVINCNKSSDTYMTYINIASHLGVDAGNQADLLIYPNPFTGSFKLNIPDVSNAEIRIFNSTGQMIYSVRSANMSNQVNASQWPAGMYFVRVTNGNKQIVTRIVVKQ
ncbi:MAG: T9SS type A sorting domain-containing protein [Bacteroidia bacterium]|nr:T9SS type A sorting domain-containing protein [Bacteroidia bacterium]